MPIVPVNGAGDVGLIQDRRPYDLPMPNAWSAVQNMRFRDGQAEKFSGHTPVFGAPGTPPYWLLPVPTSTALLWLYAGLTKVYVWDGTNHTNLTRQTAAVDVDYAATALKNWTGGVLGGIPILNNGVDPPQMWLPVNTGQRLQELANWTAGETCGALRPFKQFLVALDITDGTGRYPHLVKWSHPADPSSVPVSWDHTDPTRDTGIVELKETSDFLLDLVPLRDIAIIYKEHSIWGMQFVGGLNIFRFFKISTSFGALSRRCACEYKPGMHVVFGADDIIVHDGQSAQSIISDRVRKTIYSEISGDSSLTSFVTANHSTREVWFCYAVEGTSLPSKAVVWNWETGSIGLRDLHDVAHAVSSIVDVSATGDQWDSDSEAWDSDTTPWDELLFSPVKRRLLMAAPVANEIQLADESSQFGSTMVMAKLEREGLPLPLRVGQPPDMTTMKQFRTLWPRIQGTTGGVVKVSVGAQMQAESPPIYQAPRDYIIGTTEKINCNVSGRLLAVKFESDGALSWTLSGYEIDVVPRGRY